MVTDGRIKMINETQAGDAANVVTTKGVCGR